MRRLLGVFALFSLAAFGLAGFTLIGGPLPALAGAVYDMTAFLNEPHPFATPNTPAPGYTYAPPPSPASAPAPLSSPLSSPAQAPSPAPLRSFGRPQVAAGAAPEDRLISEIRGGVLKHAFAIGHDSKETGIDVNVEVLFNGPDWGWWQAIWAPRPHIGSSFNGSLTNTDHIYSGLTWEWAPYSWLFFDLALGLSIHNGMLDNSMIDGKTRFDRREFGCRVVGRAGLDVGWRINRNHSLSLMWEHLSHGGICNEENEGLDNFGLRYGYRF